MYKKFLTFALSLSAVSHAWSMTDTLSQRKSINIDEIVITGSRSETDSRRLPSTISVIDRGIIEGSYESSLLPTLSSQVPGLFITSRGILGYGVSTGAAGGMTLRGIGNSPTSGLLVLIDGHPQYMGLMGHPIADAYQSVLAEKVEVVRGPASVLYGSNAMGGVINIVTRQATEGSHTHARIGYGSFNTLTSEVTHQSKIKHFGSTVSAFYNRTDGHRRDMAFEQMGGVLKLSYDISSAWNIIGDLNVTHFNAANPGPVNAPRIDNDSHITRGMSAIAIQNRYKKSWGAINAFFNWGRHRINDGYVQGGKPLDYRFNSKDRMAGISFYQNATFFTGNLITAGFDYQRFGGKAWNHFLNTDTDQPLVDKTIDDLAIYRLPSRYRKDDYAQCGSPLRPQLAHRQRMDSTRRPHPASAPQNRAESRCKQRFQKPNHSRDVHVSAAKSQFTAGKSDQLRNRILPEVSTTRCFIRRKRFLSARK